MSPMKLAETVTTPEFKTIIDRLEEAGRTLYLLHVGGYSPKLAQPRYDVVRRLFHDSADEPPPPRLPLPDQEAVNRMDEAYDWVLLIPAAFAEIRRVVQARSLVNPYTGQYLYSCRRLAEVMHTDHKMIQRMHLRGIKIIFESTSQMPHSEVRNSLSCG